MSEDNIRVVIDTNIWIAFLIGKALSGLTEAILSDRIRILFSEELLEELIAVLNRPKFRKYFSQKDKEELLSLLHYRTEKIVITEQYKDCRDPKDNFLLDLCVSGKADYLITGDADLLELNPFHGTEIISYRLFQDILESLDLRKV